MLMCQNYLHESPQRRPRPLDTYNGEDFFICIPRAYARKESNIRLKMNECGTVEHYRIHIVKQVGTVQNRRDTYLFLYLPKQNMYVPIILYMDGGVNFDPKFHKFVLREYDAIDRNIILGFCIKHEGLLHSASYGSNSLKSTLELEASYYRYGDMPKRLKLGSRGYDFTKYYTNLEPYEEATNIFSSICFI